MWSVGLALGGGLATIAVVLAVLLSHAPVVVLSTNSIPAATIVASTRGGTGTCQDNELLPQGTTAVRLWITGNVKPGVQVEALSDFQPITSGSQEGGWLGKVVTVPVGLVARTVPDAQLCFTIDPAIEEVDLIGGAASHHAAGESRGKVRIEYLRVGHSSWWSLARSVTQRVGLGRAPSGGWVFLIPLAAMALVVALVSWAIFRRLGRGRRLPRAAWVCAGIACLSAVSWSIVTPPFQVTDEPSHFSYAQILAETGHLPRSHSTIFSAEELVAERDLNQHYVRFNPALKTISNEFEQQRLEQDLAAPLSRVGQGAAVATPQPPLYYALETVPYYLGASGNLLDRLQLMRLLSALTAGLTALFAYLFLREALSAVPWAWTVGGLCTALAPLVGFIAGAVNPDGLLCAVSAALFYCLARAFRRGLTPRRAIAIGAVTAIGFLTKLNFVGLAPGIALALLLLTVRAARTNRRSAYRSLALAVAVGAGPVCVYVLINLLTHHAGLGFVSTGIKNTSGHSGSLSRELSYIWQSYLPRLPGMTDYFPGISTFRQLWFDRLVGLYGWLDTRFPDWVYDLALIPAGAIAVLCARELLRTRAALRRRGAELLSYAAIAAGLLMLIGVSSYLEYPTRAGAYSEPRYLLPLAMLFAAVLALAARGAGRRWGPAVGTLIIVLFLAYDIFSQLQVVARFYS
jgi:hypothetical protein